MRSSGVNIVIGKMKFIVQFDPAMTNKKEVFVEEKVLNNLDELRY